ncbi:phospholipase D family protein [Parvibaculum sp.]|uniref:phospholipase D family protein n=1 Tax=Parvibaculum sp. TaxID=2024848 RepID=UPI0038B31E77
MLELIRGATSRIVIAAPYIKSLSIRRALSQLPATVTECICVTRWLPEDIAVGACDLEIFDELADAPGGKLFVHPHLHAKYYADGVRALVGSANLTARGLGWHTPSNVELLVSLPQEFPGLMDWESMLLRSAIPATEELRDQIRRSAEELRRAYPMQNVPDVGDEAEEEPSASLWIPLCPAPERLWGVYRGRDADTMVSSAYEAARADLAALAPPQGLTENLFVAYLAGILRQMPILVEIDKLATTGLTDGGAHEFLADRLGETSEQVDPHQAWRVLKAWLVHFFPESYRLETGQEVLVKGRELPRR